MKRCSKCGKEKDEGSFAKDKYGLRCYCKSCGAEACRKWYKENRDKVIEVSRQWRKKNPGKAREARIKWRKNNPDKELARCRLKMREDRHSKNLFAAFSISSAIKNQQTQNNNNISSS